MQLLLRNDGLYIATDDDNRGMKAISLEDLIFKLIGSLKEAPNSTAIHDLSEVNNWLFNYQIDLGDAIEQRKQESLLDKLKELRNEILTGEKETAATNLGSGEFSYMKEPYDVHKAIRIKLDDIINNHQFLTDFGSIEGGKMNS
tara:strand:- start:858 stop:1289 length:432 start_codon:yes stop_codon:yes gene_type:complete